MKDWGSMALNKARTIGGLQAEAVTRPGLEGMGALLGSLMIVLSLVKAAWDGREAFYERLRLRLFMLPTVVFIQETVRVYLHRLTVHRGKWRHTHLSGWTRD